MVKSKLQKLYRSEKDRTIAGVAGGLGDFFSTDPVFIRIMFVLMSVFGGGGVFIYIILWIVIPSKSKLGKPSEEYIQENVEELKTKSQEIAGKEPRVLLGIIIIVIGSSLLMQNFGFYKFDFLWKFWPLALIALGFTMLSKKK
ncbi:PspC domain-containing protein [Candidatus Microgenomates bacterium]|nr:PspC domain-containing protein [Candidatus Microgenomates bacterium]